MSYCRTAVSPVPNVSVAGKIDVDAESAATTDPVSRGSGHPFAGDPLDPVNWAAFSGEFADAQCSERVSGRETGIRFSTNPMNSNRFFAELGREGNGVFLG